MSDRYPADGPNSDPPLVKIVVGIFALGVAILAVQYLVALAWSWLVMRD